MNPGGSIGRGRAGSLRAPPYARSREAKASLEVVDVAQLLARSVKVGKDKRYRKRGHIMNQTDVIIVGLGPTGATLAGLLGRRGVSTAVFDCLPDLFPLPRAIGLDHEVMRIMQEFGVAERVAPHVSPYRPSEYRGMQGQLIRRLDAAPPPFRLGWAPNYVFEQPAFERILRGRLAELPNVAVRCPAEVQATGQDDEGAWADVRLLPYAPSPSSHSHRASARHSWTR